MPFFSRIVVNRNDPNRLAIATNYAYTTTDARLLDDATPLTRLGAIVGVTGKFSSATALAYGTQDDVDALLVGSTFTTGTPDNPVGNNWLLLANHTTALTRLANYGGDAPTSVVFDDRHAARYYVADGTKLWTNVDATTNTTFTDLSENLASLNLTRPTAVEFISHNGVNALLVGALSTVAGSASPLAVADSPTPDQLVNWRRFGNGIPNTIIGQLAYNPLYDVLAVGTFGRGAFLLYDVTTYFASATKLVYGAADNDSNPDAIWLTGNRPLEKVGTGTLTIGGTATYTGSTTVSGGTLLANGSLVSSSGLTVGPAGTVRGTGLLPATAVFGTIWPGNNQLGTLSVNGNLAFAPGSSFAVDVAANGSGKLAVAGATSIAGGSVSVFAAPGAYAPRSRYTILNSAAGVNGAFSGVNASLPSPFLQSSLGYDAQNVYLNLQIGGFAAVAQTPTQFAVGQALDASAPNATGDYATVVTALAQVDASLVPGDPDLAQRPELLGLLQLDGAGRPALHEQLLSQAGGGNRRSGSDRAGRSLRSSPATRRNRRSGAPGAARWAGWHGRARRLGSGGVTYNVGGFAGGLDRKFADNFRAGITVGYTTGSQWVSGFTGQGFSNTVQAGLYGDYAQGPVYVDALVGYAYSANQMARQILDPRPGGARRHRPDRRQPVLRPARRRLPRRYRRPGGRLRDAVRPPAGLRPARRTASPRTARSRSNLTVAAQTTNSLRTVIGAQLGGAIDSAGARSSTLQFRLGWSHEYRRHVAAGDGLASSARPAPFTTFGASPQRDGAVIGFAANTAHRRGDLALPALRGRHLRPGSAATPSPPACA